MLEKVDLSKKMGKEEYKEKMPELENRLGELQRKCRDRKIPVMIAFEGYDASGKGLQIGRLIQAMDPRGFQVHAVKKETEEERMHPFLWRFWIKLPERGRIAIFDTSWYRKVLVDRFEKKTPLRELPEAYESIRSFEKQLTDDGMVIVKLFLVIDKKEQKKRFKKLESAPDTAWRVSKKDRRRNKAFHEYEEINDEMLRKTDSPYAPWHLIEAMDKRFAAYKIYTVVIQALTEAVDRYDEAKRLEASVSEETPSGKEPSAALSGKDRKELGESVLGKVDLSRTLTREVYKERLEELQKKIACLHGEIYRRRIPVVLGFEGWDAAGKGGAIKRLTECMDPRGYVVNPTASPNAVERGYHYLWRFWRAMPKDGHAAVFDRTWYGRVMVERIEGFCTTQEWKRAYQEINDMEHDLVNAGAVVLKFWMQIDREEQKRRFEERQNNPQKQWKITEEDWRNREKWDAYEEAVNEMLLRTSTQEAPWIVVEGNDKYYARIKVLECVADAVEARLQS